MLTVQPILQQQGTVRGKNGRKTVQWCIRYREINGRRRQRSIYIGTDPVLLKRARHLLSDFQCQTRWKRELEVAARKMRRIIALLKRPYRSDRKSGRCAGHTSAKATDFSLQAE
jgi:hypothetical protein